MTKVGILSAIERTPANPVDTPISRVRELYAHLLGHDTATEGLMSWCAACGLGEGPISAQVYDVQGVRRRDGAIWSRRVMLSRGAVLLSCAEIRFRTDALTSLMLQRLAQGSVPFGAIVKPLRPWRTVTFASALAGDSILELHATVRAGTGLPIARVREAYRRVLIVGGV